LPEPTARYSSSAARRRWFVATPISERYRDQELLRNTQIPLESPMPRPNIDTMTVRQLIDIVAFLDSKYEIMVEDYD
jgi:hypothetical protein